MGKFVKRIVLDIGMDADREDGYVCDEIADYIDTELDGYYVLDARPVSDVTSEYD